MKYTFALLLFGATLFITGCSKKDSNPLVPPAGGTPPTFTMHLESGTQGMKVFASPSTDVRLTQVILSFPAQQFTDSLTNPSPADVFPKNTKIQLAEYTGIEGGQQWVLKFIGFDAITNQPFEVTMNWTVV